ncbi:DUF3726 domain-containing protein [Ruegeria sp. HKCCD4884]|uniref:DUF3726 domain-containing protein n=1 Tax=Ruegeria sp. HKCCD4884 TaxID=2683022 RepID=UPI0014909886|nr:DUF3726 domain-containing protein [Ruegeria sp. HKCCD4884]NOD95071.1 DUF3726 domain-containing protein [Ruegeria sp. HKCCD4884]
MNFSLNEMEATAKRATRGAGYSWGQAEEASKAARWLCVQGLDGAGILSSLLEQGLASDPAAHRPRQIDRLWQGQRALCPLSAGPLLSDAAHLLKTGPIEMQYVAVPALMLPFARHAARILNEALTIEIDAVQFVVSEGWLVAQDSLPEAAHEVVVSRGGAPTTLREQQTRAYPDPQDWDTLNRFAHRTYAPATEESRLLGAGSGLSDND